jgi:hypothetical protein
MVFHRTNGEIAWSCDVCGDEGVIAGWQGSQCDGDGDVVEMARDVFDVVRGVLLLDAARELLDARAQGTSSGVLMSGRVGAFEELVEYVASGANAETDRRRRRRLDDACQVLEDVLAS